jgi:hypothetical protein
MTDRSATAPDTITVWLLILAVVAFAWTLGMIWGLL